MLAKGNCPNQDTERQLLRDSIISLSFSDSTAVSAILSTQSGTGQQKNDHSREEENLFRSTDSDISDDYD